MEVYRYLVDDFVVDYCQSLSKRDFTSKSEAVSRNRKGRREYLRDARTREFMALLDDFFESVVDVPRLKYGERQSITSLINEEALLLGSYLRDENIKWKPRTPDI
jgi:hypothetical protein